jgi:hypothetical protein
MKVARLVVLGFALAAGVTAAWAASRPSAPPSASSPAAPLDMVHVLVRHTTIILAK